MMRDVLTLVLALEPPSICVRLLVSYPLMVARLSVCHVTREISVSR